MAIRSFSFAPPQSFACDHKIRKNDHISPAVGNFIIDKSM